jgi:hypothetical protein
MEAIMEDKAEDFAYDLRCLIDNNMIDCDDDEVVGSRVERVEPLRPGTFEVKRPDGTTFIVTVTEI